MAAKLTYYPQIDTLRFLAVLMVCLSHWLPGSWVYRFQLGRAGVELFFVISGFLITGILLHHFNNRKTVIKNIGIFFIRRVLRIFPAYYFVVLLTYVFHDGHFKEAIWWNLSYLSNIYMIKIDSFPGIMSHFWSLSVEEHFYLVWPLLIAIFPQRRAIYAILIMTVLGLGSRLLLFHLGFSDLTIRIFSISCFDAFAIGAFLALLKIYYTDYYTKITNLNPILPISIIGILSILYFVNHTQGDCWDLIWFRLLISVGSLFLINYAINSQAKFYRNKYLIFLGKISYSMYLFHNFVPGFLLGLKSPENIYLRVILYLTVLIAISFISYKLIELPFNKIKKRYSYLGSRGD